MTEQRIPLDDLTSDQLDALYDERDRYFHFACAARGASGAPDFPDLTDTILALYDRAEQAEAAVERALAVLAPYDWRHAQVNAAAVRDALAPQQQQQQPTT